jgi:hypothetical protein
MTTFDDYVIGDPDAVSLGRLPCLEDDQGVQLVLTNEAVGRTCLAWRRTRYANYNTLTLSRSLSTTLFRLSRALSR